MQREYEDSCIKKVHARISNSNQMRECHGFINRQKRLAALNEMEQNKLISKRGCSQSINFEESRIIRMAENKEFKTSRLQHFPKSLLNRSIKVKRQISPLMKSSRTRHNAHQLARLSV